MQQEIKDKFPNWCQDTDTDYNLVLSDDLDSLFSCIILNYIRRYEIKYFYNFNSYYVADNAIKGEKCIGVDADLINEKRCWGNHVTLTNNSANLNTIMNINQKNYIEKFCGSTLLTILSYYDCTDLSNLSEEAKMILLCIDSTFLGYWFKEGYYCKKYLKLLELDELIEVLERHTKQEFEDLNYKYNLKSKIYLGEDKQLHTRIKLDKLGELFPKLSFVLPKNKFIKKHDFKIVQSSYLQHTEDKIFSCARTYRNALRYSVI